MRFHFTSAHFGGKPPWGFQVNAGNHNVTTSYYTDKNSPSRHLAFHPRLKSKVPKMLEWRHIDADWYVWLDSSVRIISDTITDDILALAGPNKLCLFRHPERTSIQAEANFVLTEIGNGNPYVVSRYSGEPIMKQVNTYIQDQSFLDTSLFWMGFFAYHSSQKALMQEWFMQNILWSVQDQISFPYVLAKSSMRYSLFPGDVFNNNFVKWDLGGRELVSSF